MSFIWMIYRQFYWKRDKKWFCAVWRVDCERYLLHETKSDFVLYGVLTVSGTFCTRQKWFCSVWCVDCEWYLLHETKVILFCMVCWLWVVPSARDKSDFVLYGVLTVSGTFCTRQKVILCCMACWLWVVPSARDKSDFVLYGVLTVSGTFCTRQKWFCAVCRVDCEWYLLHETKVILFCMVCWLWVVPSARDKSDFVLCAVLTVSGTFCTRQKWFCSVWCADCEWYLLHETKVILCCMACWLWVVPSARDKKWFCAVWRVDCEWYLLHETKSDFVLYGVLTVSGTFCTRQKVILCCMACWLWVVPSARDKKWFCAVCRVDCEWYLLHALQSLLQEAELLLAGGVLLAALGLRFTLLLFQKLHLIPVGIQLTP